LYDLNENLFNSNILKKKMSSPKIESHNKCLSEISNIYDPNLSNRYND